MAPKPLPASRFITVFRTWSQRSSGVINSIYSSNRKTNLQHPILAMPRIYQMISTFLPLFRLLPLLIFSTLYSTATSTGSATFVKYPIATDLTIPISPPCPLIPNLSLKKYLSLGHCHLQESLNLSAHELRSTPPNCGEINWSSEDEACISYIYTHFTNIPHFLETSNRLEARDSAKVLRWVLLGDYLRQPMISRLKQWVRIKTQLIRPIKREYAVQVGLPLALVLATINFLDNRRRRRIANLQARTEPQIQAVDASTSPQSGDTPGETKKPIGRPKGAKNKLY